MVSKAKWQSLEGNPEIINKFIEGLGFKTNLFKFNDVLSCEEWAQEMISKPCLAIIFLYPETDNIQKYEKQLEEQISKTKEKIPQNLFFMKQYAENACGTIAIFHAILNLIEEQPDIIQQNSYFKKFKQATQEMNSEERGKYFEAESELEELHQMAVEEGETEVNEYAINHFICFIEKNEYLYEMDGMKQCPISHGNQILFIKNQGKILKNEILKKSCEIIKNTYMVLEPEDLRFTILALQNNINN